MKFSPSVEVITFTYNESFYIDYLVKWYRARFRNLTITVFDNYSTDDTVAKAQALGCKVETWGSPHKKIQVAFRDLKNSCFKNGESDFFLICDIDELLDVSDADLVEHWPTVVRGVGYEMVGNEKTKLEEIRFGARSIFYDKCFLFRRDTVLEVNYNLGAHACKPVFVDGHQVKEYLRRNLYHFRWLSLQFVSDRYERNAKRVSDSDRRNGYSSHYFKSSEEIASEFAEVQNNSISLPVNWSPEI